jgi:hypothetical protein
VFLAGAASSALLVACGGDDGGGAQGPTTTEDPGPRGLGAGFADGYASDAVLVAGIPQRAPLVVVESRSGPVRGASAPDSIAVEVRTGGAVVHTQTIPKHTDGIPTPYYPLVFTPATAGDYEVRASFTDTPMPFRVTDPTKVNLVQVGAPLRPAVTPTVDNSRGVDPICTRPDRCPFHTMTLTDAMASGKPVAFIIATPGFCQTAICGPVLELLIDAQAGAPGLQYVHAEVYVAPNSTGNDRRKTTDVVAAYGLSYEPTILVANKAGIVTARLDFSWDRAELAAALATATAA